LIHKLERWAWLGGALLAGNAGMVNAVGLQSYAHQAVTHVTGTATLFSLAMSHLDYETGLNLILVMGSFAAGAALAGFLVQNTALKLGRRYGIALLLESLLLFAAALLMKSHLIVGAYFASAACGLQNAMASTYSGAVLRTTHLSGMVTDVGAAFGHFLRGGAVDWLRVRLYGLLITSFIAGGVLGSLLFTVFSDRTLYIPAALTGVVAVCYTAYAHWARVHP
jgi:uncharacterized membrane protein YoaK (UPF0700 family)